MLRRNSGVVRHPPETFDREALRARGSSPALVDVDVVDFVGADGDLGQSLDDVVALQNHVTLRGDRGRTVRTLAIGPIEARGGAVLTFCLLSSLGTCRTNRPSLSELTETPAGARAR